MANARIKAPEFPDTTEWVNTEKPVRLENHRGKVIMLDFWSSCHVGCLESQADIQYLENKFRDGLVVVGIHSPKFTHECTSHAIRQAIARQQVRHPVINDSSYDMWKRFRIKRSPSFIFIDTEGYIIGALSGAGRRHQIEGLIQKNLMQAEVKNSRNKTPFPLTEPQESRQLLSYPGRILATSDRLYISDSGHNRVLECNHEGKVLRRFGTTMAGLLDGELEESSFCNPQGLAKIGDYLYVADAGNHALRRIHLPRGEVHTVIGNGNKGVITNQDYADPGVAQLNFPWALHHHNGSLYISLAGQHQIWRWNLSMNQLAPLTGKGEEGLKDGVACDTLFAQPCGISSNSDGLFVADASSSSIRTIRMPDINVSTLIGKGLNDYGNQDGPATVARLQRPMDIAYDEKRDLLWICDTYNHTLKYLRVSASAVGTLDLSGLDEPGGLSLLEDYLWVVNTNKHEISRLDLAKGNAEVINIHE